jgi:hypothetical protein
LITKGVFVAVKHGKKTVVTTQLKRVITVLGSTKFSLRKSSSLNVTIGLNTLGKKALLSASSRAPLHATLVTTVRSGKTTNKTVRVT